MAKKYNNQIIFGYFFGFQGDFSENNYRVMAIALLLYKENTPTRWSTYFLGGGGEIRTPAPDLSRLMI
ncbi:MAG: hypothetical protein JWM07_12 [Candidatus Saccharibacteria bacterium]|nr:hypothetical protein [Candidatus Saccharibacteria bacterium]